MHKEVAFIFLSADISYLLLFTQANQAQRNGLGK